MHDRAPSTVTPASSTDARNAPRGRRLRLTVLFTDLCRSTRLGRELELEQYEELLARLQRIWRQVAKQFDGLVLRIAGDGALIVFGYPEPSEFDGLRAAEAALTIHRQVELLGVELLPASGSIAAHSGLHSGVVLVADGDAERGLFEIIGDVANTAAKLEKAAREGEILATERSLGPHAGIFVVEDAANARLATEIDAGPILRIVARTDLHRRYDAAALRGLTPLLGRNQALYALDAFLAAAPGPDRCLLAVAEAGMGKTRLLEELPRLPVLQQYTRLDGSCEKTFQPVALQPFVQMLKAYLERPHEANAAADDLARAALASGSPDAYLRFFEALAAQRAVLAVVDDWQWSDDATRALLPALLALPGNLRAVLATRPHEELTPWVASALEIPLLPLTPQESAVAVRRWLPDADPILAAQIHQYAGGVPLFIEELCHSASSHTLAQALGGRSGKMSHAWLASIIASRVAALAPRQSHALRAASVVGVDVPRDLLDLTCGEPLSAGDLAALSRADLLHADGDGAMLRFKHGITRDAIYETIGLPERRLYHERIRAALLASADAPSRENVEALAHHCWGAGQWRDAARYGELAGDRSMAAFAMDRARRHYGNAMDAIDHLAGRSRDEILQWCQLANKLAMAAVFDPLALDGDSQVFERAVALAQAQGDLKAQARALYWLAWIHYTFGRYPEAADRARAARTMSERVGDERLTAQIDATLGQILAARCEYDEAITLIDAALAAKRRNLRPDGGLGTGASYALACKGNLLADRGDFAAAAACFDAALGQLGTTMHPIANSVRNWITVGLIWQGRWDDAERVAQDSVRIGEGSRALLLIAVSRSTLGYTRWCRDRDPDAFAMLRDAVGWMAARQGQFLTSLHFGWLCEALVVEGEATQARRSAAHVLRRARQGERAGEGHACRAMVLAAVRGGRLGEARRWLARADRSTAARKSPREAALNDLLRARVLEAQGEGDAAARLLSEARQQLERMGVTLPTWLADAP